MSAEMTEPERVPPPRRGLLVFALATVLFMASLDQTVVGTALPRIATELGGLEWYAWVFTAYMLASTAVVPVAGKLGDLYGRRLLLVIGIVEFLISSALAGFSSSMEFLVATRALQGIGAGILVANAQAAVGDLFPPAQLSKYNGMLSGVHALASLVGPLLGGAITDAIGWRWVFLINLPVGLLALFVLLRRFQPHPEVGKHERIDLPGTVVLILAIVAWLTVFNELESAMVGAWGSCAAAGVSALLLTVLFVRIELRSSAPLLPIPLLADRELRATLLITFACGVGIYVAAIFMPLMLQESLDLSPTEAGLVMTPMVFGLVAGGVVGGIRVSRVARYRSVIAVGMLVATIGAIALAVAARQPSALAIAGWMALVGIGVGLTIPASMSAAQNAVAHGELGLVTSLSKFARSFGGIVGLGVLGAVLHVQTLGQLEGPRAGELLAHATANLLWAVVATFGLAVLVSLRLRDRPLRSDFGAAT
jgi:EmrB/QacA subfamily drug resistance transporter